MTTTFSDLQFGKQLAHANKKNRDNAVTSLIAHLKSDILMSDLEYLKLWKGLYYCFWMSDKPLVQQDLALNLSTIFRTLPIQSALSYLKSFWITIVKEWYGIDRLRLDKYYMLLRKFHASTFEWLDENQWDISLIKDILVILTTGPLSINIRTVPDSLRYHTVESFFQEYSKLSFNNDISEDVMELFIQPFVTILKSSTDPKLVNHVLDDVLALYTVDETELVEEEEKIDHILPSKINVEKIALILYKLPTDETVFSKNRKILSNFLKAWGKKVGIPFVDSKIITGMSSKKVIVPFDPTSVKKRKVDSIENVNDSLENDWVLVDSKNDVVMDGTIETIDSTKPKSKKSKVDKSQTLAKVKPAKVSKVEEDRSEDSTTSNKIKKKADKVIVETNESTESTETGEVLPVAKKLTKTAAKKLRKTKKLQSIRDFEALVAQVSNSEQTDETPEQHDNGSSPESKDKKSVRWGEDQKKTFYKMSVICTDEEAQKSPVITKSAPKILKKNFDTPLISEVTVPARASKRKNLKKR